MVSTTLDGSWDIPIGAPVFTADDKQLGYVVEADPYKLVVGEGFLFRHHYAIELAAVERYADGALVLKYTWDQVMDRTQNI
jgi:hypothetical protein